jgi:hypothetical protein
MADDRLKIVRKVWSKLFFDQNFFYLPTQKIHDFYLEKHPPAQKRLFFLGWAQKIRPVNLEVTWADDTTTKTLKIIISSFYTFSF